MPSELQIIEDSVIKTCLDKMQKRGWEVRAFQSEIEYRHLGNPTTKEEFNAAFLETANRLLRYWKQFLGRLTF